MIQVTAVEIEELGEVTKATAYLSKVDQRNGQEGWRLIWVEKGESKQSNVCWYAAGTPVLEVVAGCYQDEKMGVVGL